MSPRKPPDDEIVGGEEVPREIERPRGLDDWMARMESKLDKLATDMAEVKAMRARVDEHHERLYGNGQPGLIKDVDRIKQWRKAIYWWIGIAVSAPALAVIVKTLVSK